MSMKGAIVCNGTIDPFVPRGTFSGKHVIKVLKIVPRGTIISVE